MISVEWPFVVDFIAYMACVIYGIRCQTSVRLGDGFFLCWFLTMLLVPIWCRTSFVLGLVFFGTFRIFSLLK